MSDKTSSQVSSLRMLKYPLFRVNDAVFDEIVEVMAPPSTGVAHIAMQNGVVTLWALVNMEHMPVKRRFHIVGTGHEAPCGHYLGTVHERVFVWHVFELF